MVPAIQDLTMQSMRRQSGKLCRSVLEDVILQGVLADDEELVAPALIVVVGEVEDDVDEVANVLDAGCMTMQIDDSGSLV
jgi:hypothetical protein